MKISYDVTEDEFIRAYERFWRAHKQGANVAHVAGLAGVLFGIYLFFFLPKIRILAAILIALGALLGLFPFLRRRLYRGVYRRNPNFGSVIETDFRGDLISTNSGIGKSEFEWSVYSRAFETDEAFLLSFTKYMFSIVPKRALANDAEIAAFRDLIGEKVEPVKKI